MEIVGNGILVDGAPLPSKAVTFTPRDFLSLSAINVFCSISETGETDGT
jgi:hypothetical protein